MQYRSGRNLMVLLALLALFCATGIRTLEERGKENERRALTPEDPEYRREFFCDDMRREKEFLSRECRNLLENVEKEAIYFPIPLSSADRSLQISYTDSWMKERSYKGVSGHEGTDLMASCNERGVYPVLSICDGVVTNLGWLEKGGYRIGITSDSGTYYYYAHLDSYGNLKEGERVRAGELLGYMGDSGYGPEGTTGKFDVHLHLGIYLYRDGTEISLNPYYLLRHLEKHKLIYSYF